MSQWPACMTTGNSARAEGSHVRPDAECRQLDSVAWTDLLPAVGQEVLGPFWPRRRLIAEQGVARSRRRGSDEAQIRVAMVSAMTLAWLAVPVRAQERERTVPTRAFDRFELESETGVGFWAEAGALYARASGQGRGGD
jgi:hypothetical protein